MAGSSACSDLVVLAAQHLRALLERVPGPKVLLLDHETTGFVSVILSQSEILQKEVFLVDRLDALPRGHFQHLSCVCFLRPTSENLLLLLQLQQQQLPPALLNGDSGGGGGSSSSYSHNSSHNALIDGGKGGGGNTGGLFSLHAASASSASSSSSSLSSQRGGDIRVTISSNNNADGQMNLLQKEEEERQQQQQTRFRDIHLFFSSSVQQQQPQMLRRLAKQDENEKIVQVQELYVDIYVLSPHVFTLNIPSVAPLQQQEVSLWTAYEESVFQRMQDGVFSSVLLLRTLPLIRFQSNSPVCKRLAAALLLRCAENLDLFEKKFTPPRTEGSADASAGAGGGAGSGGTSGRRLLLLLVDRREDPVTPLLNQWTYRAMLHELIGIHNNRVDLRRIPGIKPEQQDVVMNPTQDRFYRDHLDANFGDLGLAVQQYVREYQEKTQSTGQLESVEDMQRFVDAYPEIQKLSGNVSKHVSVIHALSRIVSERHLLDVSSLEQEIACREAKGEHFSGISKVLQNPRITNLDKLRLVLLFALRYEGDSRVAALLGGLRAAGIEEEEVSLVRALLQHAGAARREGDLFSNKNFLAVARNSIQRGLKGTTNVYTQHRSLLWRTVDSLIRGKLSTEQYAVATPGGGYGGGSMVPTVCNDYSFLLRSAHEKPQTVVVFFVGGATYEEARDMEELSRQSGCNIILGGSTFLNSRSFLADVSQLIKGHTFTSVPLPL